MSGTAYPPLTSVVSIYNPNMFPDKDQPITESEANLKYLQTANVNQSSGGTKTFSDLRSSDIAFTAPGKPLRWEAGGGNGTTRLVPIPSTLFDKQYRLPFDNAYTTDDLVGRQSSATLLNKTISAGKFTGQSMFTGSIYGNNSTSFPITRSYKSSSTSNGAASPVITYQMQWPIGTDGGERMRFLFKGYHWGQSLNRWGACPPPVTIKPRAQFNRFRLSVPS